MRPKERCETRQHPEIELRISSRALALLPVRRPEEFGPKTLEAAAAGRQSASSSSRIRCRTKTARGPSTFRKEEFQANKYRSGRQSPDREPVRVTCIQSCRRCCPASSFGKCLTLERCQSPSPLACRSRSTSCSPV